MPRGIIIICMFAGLGVYHVLPTLQQVVDVAIVFMPAKEKSEVK